MKKIKSVMLASVASVALCSTFCTNVSIAQSTSEWKYAKVVSVGFSVDKMSLYYQEDCTSDAGDQCTQPKGSFRTYFGFPNIF